MKIPIYQIDAFTDQMFAGNPAAVCYLDEWLSNETMQSIAIENNLAETAFIVPSDGYFDITWFTPGYEIDLCGHATLASAFVIWHYLGHTQDTIEFRSRKSGVLLVKRKGKLLELDFPARLPKPVAEVSDFEESLGIKPVEVLKSRDFIVVLDNEDAVRNVTPNYALFANLDALSVCVTAQGDKRSVDFVSRCFDKMEELGEDPVTGSTHCSLIPYWANKLQKHELMAHQISPRGGVLHCQLAKDRVLIAGEAVTYLKGEIYL